MSIKGLCHMGGFCDATFYDRRARFGGIQASEVVRLREVESANAKLKQLLAEARLHIKALQLGFGVGC